MIGFRFDPYTIVFIPQSLRRKHLIMNLAVVSLTVSFPRVCSHICGSRGGVGQIIILYVFLLFSRILVRAPWIQKTFVGHLQDIDS